ncbi:hypothetical protein PIB30_064953 [Stylosanthes scabra]|uniref:Xylanase inhibitor C-terminal domain-containing protein n=1 Tax=Stylosanthes scabra TaxID=79078 RepID=A0ABU6RM52_9FABA|nr:hypothetical protein [Stylosanthes scabra]
MGAKSSSSRYRCRPPQLCGSNDCGFWDPIHVSFGSIYSALKEEFIAQTKGVLTLLNDPGFVFQKIIELCYNVKADGVSFGGAVPAVTLEFEGAEMRVSRERLLYRLGEVAGGD